MQSPAHSGGRFAVHPVVTAELPVIFGRRFRGHEVTLTPLLVDDVEFRSSRSINELSVGGAASLLFRLGQRFRLGPEVTDVFPLTSRGEELADAARSTPQVHLGVVAMFGR